MAEHGGGEGGRSVDVPETNSSEHVGANQQIILPDKTENLIVVRRREFGTDLEGQGLDQSLRPAASEGVARYGLADAWDLIAPRSSSRTPSRTATAPVASSHEFAI